MKAKIGTASIAQCRFYIVALQSVFWGSFCRQAQSLLEVLGYRTGWLELGHRVIDVATLLDGTKSDDRFNAGG